MEIRTEYIKNHNTHILPCSVKLMLILPLSYTIKTVVVAATIFDNGGCGCEGGNEGVSKTQIKNYRKQQQTYQSR